MLRLGLLALGVLLLFGLFFALLPAPASLRSSGVTLDGVKLQLYPAQDPNAQWRFAARQIQVNPEKGETSLDQLGTGERWVSTPLSTQPLKRSEPKLDMTIQSSHLVIDAQDNLHAEQASLYSLADCSTFELRAQGDQQVVINQQGGYTAPLGAIHSPVTSGAFKNIVSNFDFSSFQAEQNPGAEFHAAPPSRCVNGRQVPRSSRVPTPKEPL